MGLVSPHMCQEKGSFWRGRSMGWGVGDSPARVRGSPKGGTNWLMCRLTVLSKFYTFPVLLMIHFL